MRPASSAHEHATGTGPGGHRRPGGSERSSAGAEGADGDATPSARAARAAFGVYAAAAIPLIVLGLGSFHWFMRDDWMFITEREVDSLDDLFAPHNGHWSTVPIVAFRALWAMFGIRTYVPYQLVVVTLHIGTVALLRVVMRRAGVGPWLATAAAGSLVLFGPGRQDIIWAFQVGLTGGIFFGLVQLLLADHEGAVGRRDATALCAGLLAIMSAGTGVPMVGATGITLLLRRGWRRALLHTAPLGAIYVAWTVAFDVEAGARAGRPDLEIAVSWLRNGYEAVFDGLGSHPVVAMALAVLLAVGLGSLLVAPVQERGDHLRRAAGPLALLLASLVFMVLTLQARWFLGAAGARAGRYLYIGAVLVVPAIALAAQQLARRWRVTAPLLPALLLVAVPANVAAFDDPPFAPSYHEHRRALLTTAVRTPHAHDVPPDARPVPDPFVGDGLDMGFLLQAAETGKLEPSEGPIPPAIDNELAVRLHLRQVPGGDALDLADVEDVMALAERCTPLGPDEDLRPVRGTVYLWDGARGGLRIRPVEGGRPIDPAVAVEPSDGNAMVAETDGRAFDWEPVAGAQPFELCEVR